MKKKKLNVRQTAGVILFWIGGIGIITQVNGDFYMLISCLVIIILGVLLRYIPKKEEKR